MHCRLNDSTITPKLGICIGDYPCDTSVLNNQKQPQLLGTQRDVRPHHIYKYIFYPFLLKEVSGERSDSESHEST